MADWLVGPVMEKLIDACFEYLKDQVRWQTGMKKELQSLREIHPQIQAVVSAYSQLEIKDPALNKWLWKLRDAIDEADDVLDELEYRKREQQASNNKKTRKAALLQRSFKIGKKVRSIMKYLKRKVSKICKRAVRIDPELKRLEEAVQKLRKISAEVSTFLHLLDGAKQEQQEQQLELHRTRETGSMAANVLLGRSREMEFVRRWLRNPYETEVAGADLYRNISLLSVVGHGGMGKTTLLQHVYEDGTMEEFDVKMWVCVSNNFDAKVVIKNILESLKKEKTNLDSLEPLQRSLQSEVMAKRFLLVLDDIWEEDEGKWENVLAPFRYGSSGSKILITTRMHSAALKIAKMIKNNQTWQLESLEKDECLSLLNTHAFARVENPDDEFRSISRKMVEKLSGCPLAAKVIGGILNSNIDKSYWTKVLNTNIGNVEPGQNYLLPILKLSYIYLLKFLQNCFAFCCMFPQDHEFDKDDLVRMWIVLGFIQSSDIQRETLEDAGRRYFNILVQKSFFDEFRADDDKVYYKMHDLLHELAQSISSQECFRFVDYKELPIPCETIRHLSVNIYGSLEAALQKMGKFKNLRSLFLSFYAFAKFDENGILEILKASKGIRLLVICFMSIQLYKYNIHWTIGLNHLRYLKVECGYHSLELPRSISHLYHLQFLISRRLQISEMDNIGGKELKINENCQFITDELIIKDPSVLLREPLRSISSLRFLAIKKNDKLVSFPSGTEQWFLQHSSSLLRLRFHKLQSLQSLPSSLESLSSLNFLQVSNVPQLKQLPNPPPSLQELKLFNLESLQCLPSSLSTISSLVSLALINIPLLKSLPDLPSSLTSLFLKELKSFQFLPSSLSALSSLKSLELNNIPLLKSLPNLPSSLRHLTLEELEDLDCLPSCLPALYELWIYEVPRLVELPDLPASLNQLLIADCHPSPLDGVEDRMRRSNE